MNNIKIFYSKRNRKKLLLKEEEFDEMLDTKSLKKRKNFFSEFNKFLIFIKYFVSRFYNSFDHLFIC